MEDRRPGFTTRPETERDRRSTRPKPWVKPMNYLRRPRGAVFAFIIETPRGIRYNPERTRRRKIEKRALQSRDRR